MITRNSHKNGRSNQRHRTRKDLLVAAATLLKTGAPKAPDMDAVAAQARVSRATAYRYFPSIEALLIEAPLDDEMPEVSRIFDAAGDDPADRVDRAEAALHEMCCRNVRQLRLMLSASLQSSGGAMPVRQNRRSELIEAALAPSRDRFTPASYRRLCAALAMVFGTESMIVFADVLGLDAKSARRVKSWACRALVKAAMESRE